MMNLRETENETYKHKDHTLKSGVKQI